MYITDIEVSLETCRLIVFEGIVASLAVFGAFLDMLQHKEKKVLALVRGMMVLQSSA